MAYHITAKVVEDKRLRRLRRTVAA